MPKNSIPRKWAVKLPDPLFTDKFLQFADPVAMSEAELADKIKALYANVEPIYFERQGGEEEEEIAERLMQLMQDPNFQTQINHCIETLQNWVHEHLPDNEVESQRQLTEFKNRLLDGSYGDTDNISLMLSEGKRNLETIVISLSAEPGDAEKDLIKELVASPDRDGLLACAGGCSTRLAKVANQLTGSADFSPAQLSREFIEEQLETIATVRNYYDWVSSDGKGGSFAERVLIEIGVPLEQFALYEIHAVNYLNNQVRDLFPWLSSSSDPLIADYPAAELAFIVDLYKETLIQELSAERFVQYISAKLQQQLSDTAIPYAELLEKIESSLVQLGKDEKFTLHELLDDEAHLKTNLNAFKITVAERLLASGYLGIDASESSRLCSQESVFARRNGITQNADLAQFELLLKVQHVFPSNIGLTWIKLRDGSRKLFLDYLKIPGVLHNQLVQERFKTKLDALLQSPQDLRTFFYTVSKKDKQQAVELLKPLLAEPDHFAKFCNAYVDISVGWAWQCSLENGLLASLWLGWKLYPDQQPHYANYIKQTILQRMLEQFSMVTDVSLHEEMCHDLDAFIGVMKQLAYGDYTGLTFATRFALSNVDFVAIDLSDSTFMGPFKNIGVLGCDFSRAKLNNVKFLDSIVARSTFDGCDLRNTAFANVGALLPGTAESLPSSIDVQTRLDLQNRENTFKDAKFSTNSCSQLLEAHLRYIYTAFEETPALLAALSVLRKAPILPLYDMDLQEVNFSDPSIKGLFKEAFRVIFSHVQFQKDQVLDFSELKTVEIRDVKLDGITIEKLPEESIIFQHCDLTTSQIHFNAATRFLDGVQLSEQQFLQAYAQGIWDFSQVELSPSSLGIEIVGLPGITLSTQIFCHLLKQGVRNFDGVNLSSVDFQQQAIKDLLERLGQECSFNQANLENADLSHYDNLALIPLETAKLTGVRVEGSQLSVAQWIVLREQRPADSFDNEIVIGRGKPDAAALRASFRKASLSQKTFASFLAAGYTNFAGVDFHRINFQDPLLRQYIERQTSEFSFKQANLLGVDLSGYDLSKFTLQEAKLSRVKIKDCSFTLEQFFEFYKQGHKDFRSNKITETNRDQVDTSKSLRRTLLSQDIFEKLVKAGFYNFKGVDLEDVPHEIILQHHQEVQARGQTLQLDDALVPTADGAAVAAACLKPKAGRPKRDLPEEGCLLFKKELEELYRNKNDVDSYLDSDSFLNKLREERNPLKRSQMLALAKMAKEQDRIAGTKVDEVHRLVRLETFKGHLETAGRIANYLNLGLMGNDLAVKFAHNDIEGIAINMGFVAGAHLTQQFGQGVLALGGELVEGKRLILGKALQASSPFLSRSANLIFMGFDLVQQVNALNQGEQQALAGVIGDSLFIADDVVVAGIELSEILGLINGVAEVAGPIGEVVGALLFVGMRIYSAEEQVKQINAKLHLSGLEKFREGWRAFLGEPLSPYLQEEIEIKEIWKHYIEKILQFLQQHPEIYTVYLPSLDMQRVAQYRCNGRLPEEHEEHYAVPHLVLPIEARLAACKISDITPVMYANNEVSTWSRHSRVYLSASNATLLEFMRRNQLACVHMEYEQPDLSEEDPKSKGFDDGPVCSRAIGVRNPSTRGTVNAFFLGKGDDVIDLRGADASFNTLIVIPEGNKTITAAGNRSNISVIITGEWVEGSFVGAEGENSLLLDNFAPHSSNIAFKLTEKQGKAYGEISDREDRKFVFSGVKSILGRSLKRDYFELRGGHFFIDGQGGFQNEFDFVVINGEDARIDATVVVNPATQVLNLAREGNFTYIIASRDEAAVSPCCLMKMEWQRTPDTEHHLLFNYTLLDIAEFHRETPKGIEVTQLEFLSAQERERLAHYLSTMDTSPDYFLRRLPTQLSHILKQYNSITMEARTRILLDEFPEQGLLLFKSREGDKWDSQLKFAQNGLAYAQSMLDGTSRSLEQWMLETAVVALRQKILVMTKVENSGETIVANFHDQSGMVLNSDPFAQRTLLLGMKGGSVYVVNPPASVEQTSRVDLYHIELNAKEIRTADVLDLRPIEQALVKHNSYRGEDIQHTLVQQGDANLQLAVRATRQNTSFLLADIQLMAGIDWYQQLQVIFADSIPRNIVQHRCRIAGADMSCYGFAPVPLQFDDKVKWIVIRPTDILEGNLIKIDELAQRPYQWIRNRDNLVLRLSAAMAIEFQDFYRLEHTEKMQSLVLEFVDASHLVLQQHRDDIKRAPSFANYYAKALIPDLPSENVVAPNNAAHRGVDTLTVDPPKAQRHQQSTQSESVGSSHMASWMSAIAVTGASFFVAGLTYIWRRQHRLRGSMAVAATTLAETIPLNNIGVKAAETTAFPQEYDKAAVTIPRLTEEPISNKSAGLSAVTAAVDLQSNIPLARLGLHCFGYSDATKRMIKAERLSCSRHHSSDLDFAERQLRIGEARWGGSSKRNGIN